MSHILIVGGTGMLKDVVLYFARHHQTVSVIGRDQKKFDMLLTSKDTHGTINQIRLDYTNSEALTSKLEKAVSAYGQIDIAICWIHSTAQDAPFIIAEFLNNQSSKVFYYHILGSSFKKPSQSSDSLREEFLQFENIIYRQIILGFVIEEEGSRWMTDTEISNGVIEAVNLESEEFIVGTVDPWSSKP